MNARLHREPRERSISLRDRMHAHEALVSAGGDTAQGRPRLRVMRMAVLGSGDEDACIEKNLHEVLALQNGVNALGAHIIEHPLPIGVRRSDALMDP